MCQDPKILVVFAFFACISLVACGDDASSSGPEGGESSAVEESSSSDSVPSSSVLQSSSSAEVASSSSLLTSSSWSEAIGSSNANSSAAIQADTIIIPFALKRFDGPLSNPHKGFTVPTGGAWVFVPEFEYGPYGSLNNRAWDLVSYGSGYQQWNKLNPAKGVYDWTELEKLLNALAEHNMGYALPCVGQTTMHMLRSGMIPSISGRRRSSRRLWPKNMMATRVSNTSMSAPLASGENGTRLTYWGAKCPPIRC